MAENTTPAMCSEAVYEAACAAGLLIVTTSEEAAVQKFADAIYAMGYSDAIDFVATGESKDSRVANVREETVYEKSARWSWPDGRPDL
jgi:hypothetical protein